MSQPTPPCDTNAAVAVAFLNTAFNEHNVPTAFARYVGGTYRQLNPHAPDGAAASAAFLDAWIAGTPSIALRIHRVLADGEMVAVHSHLTSEPGERGTAVDLMRVVDGRIVEHWDVAQAVPDHMVHGNGMF